MSKQRIKYKYHKKFRGNQTNVVLKEKGEEEEVEEKDTDCR